MGKKVTTQLAIEYHISDYLISPHPKETIKHIKKKIFAREQEDWCAELWDRQCENGNKQRTYRLHKDRLEAEDYLNEKKIHDIRGMYSNQIKSN